jgi:hypothetical protein
MRFVSSVMEGKICEPPSASGNGKDGDGEERGAFLASRLRARCIALREGLAQMLLAHAGCARQKRFEAEQ